MKIDHKTLTETDFDALFVMAVRKHNLFKQELNSHAYDKDPTETNRIKMEWHNWVEENLTKRGIQMTIEPVSGNPTSLFVVVAGSAW